MRQSPDAERILNLPFAQNPRYVGRVREMANDPNMTLKAAVKELCDPINELEFEMLLYEQRQSYTAPNAAGGGFASSVSDHVEQLLEVRK